MRKIWDFNGGIHPEENKQQSTKMPIATLPMPAELVIPLQQHIGAMAKLCVSVGDQVKKGQLLAEAQGPISVNIHAPTSGTVTDISNKVVAHPSALEDLCITLKTDGKDEWLSAPVQRNYKDLKPEEILAIIREAGIAGMGGAGFPTEIKLHPPKQDKVRTLILNAAECEPYITSDDMLMRERAEQVIKGLEIMAYILTPEQCLIGIEDNKPEAAEALKRAAKDTRVEVVVIPTKYPSGGEKQLVKILTGDEIPSGKIPADVGVMCQNVATAAAVYKAVTQGEPLISRITTITGDAAAKAGNYELLIGTPISHLIEHAEIDLSKINRLIMGGPMMGFTLESPKAPIVKTSNCIIAATEDELPLPPPAQACIRCGYCVEACPMELLPQQLFWYSQSSNLEQAEQHNIMDCIECGACSYVCPSSIPLVQHYRHTKGEIKQLKFEQSKSDRARERFEFRQFRQEREKAEKEANRKARAAAAAKAQAEKAAKAAATPDEKDTKAAAIAAAVARANEKKAAQTANVNEVAEQKPDIEAMAKSHDKLVQKIEKLRETLAGMSADNPDAIAKTQRAIEKNEVRLHESEKALNEARGQEGQESQTQAMKPEPSLSPASGVAEDRPSIDELKTLVDKAKAKCEKMEAALEDAKANDGDTSKLERAVAKNHQRLKQAEANLANALAEQNEGASS